MKNKILKIGTGLAGIVLAGVIAIESLAPGMIDKKLKSQENLDRARPFVKNQVALYLPDAVDKTLRDAVTEKVTKGAIFFEVGGVDPEKLSNDITTYLQTDSLFYAHLKRDAVEDAEHYVDRGFADRDYSLQINRFPGFFSRHNPTRYGYELDFRGDGLATFGITKENTEYKPVNVIEEDCPEFYNGIRGTIREKSIPSALRETRVDIAKLIRDSVSKFPETAKGFVNKAKEKIPEKVKDDLRNAGQEAKAGAEKIWEKASDYFK